MSSIESNIDIHKKDRIIVKYKDEWYDITHFDHPGRGAGVDLADYHMQSIDNEVEGAHATDEPFFILAEAKKKPEGFQGIKYLGATLSE